MGLVQDHIIPLPPSQDCCIPQGKGIGSDANVEVIFVVPPPPKLLSTLGATVIAEDLEPWEELLEFHFPIQDNARRNNDQVWAPYSSVRGEVGKQSDRLNGLPEACRCSDQSGPILTRDAMTDPSRPTGYN